DDVDVFIEPILKKRIWHSHVKCAAFMFDELGRFEPGVEALLVHFLFENAQYLLPTIHVEPFQYKRVRYSQVLHMAWKSCVQQTISSPCFLVSSGVRRGARVTLSIFHFNSAKLSWNSM